jgi:hypothetical protein
MKTALEAADAGDALSRVAAWADKHNIDKVRVARLLSLSFSRSLFSLSLLLLFLC